MSGTDHLKGTTMFGRILLAVTLIICVIVFVGLLIGPFIFPR